MGLHLHSHGGREDLLTMKDYRYKGYTFRQTSTMTPGRGWGKENLRCLYEIDGLKSRGTRPFLTSIQQCKDYINWHIERNSDSSEKTGGKNETI